MDIEKILAEASDPATAEEALLRMARSKSSRVRRAVAQNLASPKKALGKLFAEFPDDVLDNPASAVFDLSEPSLAWISLNNRRDVARSDSTSAIVLRRLANDAHVDVRRAVAGHKNAPPDVLESLATDRAWQVRWSLASNPLAPADVLRQLATEPKEFLIREAVALNPKTPTETLNLLSIDTREDVVVAVAKNENTPIETLTLLMSSLDPNVRFTVSRNAKTTRPMLEILAMDKTHFVASAAQWRIDP